MHVGSNMMANPHAGVASPNQNKAVIITYDSEVVKVSIAKIIREGFC